MAIFSSVSNADKGKLYLGLFIVFGILGYEARKSRRLGFSKLWALVEFPSVLIIVLLCILGLLKGFWYEYPISFILAPVAFFYYYVRMWQNKIK